MYILGYFYLTNLRQEPPLMRRKDDMRNFLKIDDKTSLRYQLIIVLLIFPVFMSACSSSYERGSYLTTGDEMKEGPGIFSGESGGFYLVGGDNKKVATRSISEMNLNETSKILDRKIEQLKRDQMELEVLKRNLNEKLQN